MARPILFDEPVTASLRVRLTEGQKIRCEQVAADARQTLTDVLRTAVNSYVADYGETHPFVFCGPKRKTRV